MLSGFVFSRGVAFSFLAASFEEQKFVLDKFQSVRVFVLVFLVF